MKSLVSQALLIDFLQKLAKVMIDRYLEPQMHTDN